MCRTNISPGGMGVGGMGKMRVEGITGTLLTQTDLFSKSFVSVKMKENSRIHCEKCESSLRSASDLKSDLISPPFPFRKITSAPSQVCSLMGTYSC